jgi:aminoglycoside phosphotransferase (APT) family kinase protein
MHERERARVSSGPSLRRIVANWHSRLLSGPAGIANSPCTTDIAPVLLDYLRRRLGLRKLAFIAEPTAYSDGWETYSYGFQLKSPDPLPAALAQPLAVRIYCGPCVLPRARREIQIQRHLYEVGYPVPEPFFLEEDCAYFGGPFLLMSQVHGPTLLKAQLRRPWKLLRAPFQMARLHVRLHQLSTAGFPAPPGCLLTRRFEDMATLIREYGLQGLRPGFDWLFVHQPDPPKDPKILHLDFHPLNLLEDGRGSLVVLDWTEADLGDPHADVGTTLMLIDCLPGVKVTRLERLGLLTGRFLFRHWYLRTYRRYLPLEEGRLSYYQALAVFRRLCNYGRWLQDGPLTTGNKPALLQFITEDHRQKLERYFRKFTGVSIRL